MVRALGLGLSLIFSLLVARRLGAYWVGVYYVAISLVTVMAVFGYAGLHQATLRHTAAYIANRDSTNIRYTFLWSVFLTLIFASPLAFTLYFLSPTLAEKIYTDPALIRPLQILSIAIIPLSLQQLFVGLLNGIRKISWSITTESVIVPFVSLILLLSPVSQNATATDLASYFFIATTIALIIGLGFWLLATADLPKTVSPDRIQPSTLLHTGRPFMWIALMVMLRSRLDLFMLGIWHPSETVGVYGTALRIGALTGFLLATVDNVIAPRIAAFFENRQRKEVEQLAHQAVKLMFIISTPVLLAFWLFPRPILGLFGEEFRVGSMSLAIIGIGMFARMVVGPVAPLLMMTDHGNKLQNTMIFGLIVNLVFNLLLMPRWGMVGAAVATTLAAIVENVTALLYVRNLLSINLWGRHLLNWRRDTMHRVPTSGES